MNIVFFGTPDFAVASLKALVESEDVNVLAVVSQPDQVLGRKRILTETPVKKFALSNNLPVFQPHTKKELYEMVKDFDCDFFIVVAFGMILKQKVLDIPKIDTLNVHGSVLPKYRGPSPIHFVLLNGEKETGVTVMGLDADMDHGPIYATATVDIESDDDFTSLYDRLANIGAELLVETLPEIYSGDLEGLEQEHEQATYCKMIKKEDSLINFEEKNVEDIINMIKAYDQWPFTFMEFEDKKLKLIDVEKIIVDELEFDDNQRDSFKQLVAGQLFVYKKQLYLNVLNGVLKLVTLQLPGKNAIDYKSFLNGYGKNINRIQ